MPRSKLNSRRWWRDDRPLGPHPNRVHLLCLSLTDARQAALPGAPVFRVIWDVVVRAVRRRALSVAARSSLTQTRHTSQMFRNRPFGSSPPVGCGRHAPRHVMSARREGSREIAYRVACSSLGCLLASDQHPGKQYTRRARHCAFAGTLVQEYRRKLLGKAPRHRVSCEALPQYTASPCTRPTDGQRSCGWWVWASTTPSRPLTASSIGRCGQAWASAASCSVCWSPRSRLRGRWSWGSTRRSMGLHDGVSRPRPSTDLSPDAASLRSRDWAFLRPGASTACWRITTTSSSA